MTSQVSRTLGPSLTPSLANYSRADLIQHVTNWPADLLEKQVRKLYWDFSIGTFCHFCVICKLSHWFWYFKGQKCSEETHILGDLQCTKISADLKIARSIVRITEIQSTLHEQKWVLNIYYYFLRDCTTDIFKKQFFYLPINLKWSLLSQLKLSWIFQI